LKSRGANIRFAVFFHLLVLSAPFAIKSEHRHAHLQINLLSSTTNENIAKPADRCLICEFEFVNFVESEKEHIGVNFRFLSSVNTLVTSRYSQSLFTYHTYRGPPIA
jgi:hypothetical protein